MSPLYIHVHMNMRKPQRFGPGTTVSDWSVVVGPKMFFFLAPEGSQNTPF
jgi:hypothetical protein